MLVTLTEDWGNHKAGTTIDPGNKRGQILMDSNRATLAAPPPPAVSVKNSE